MGLFINALYYLYCSQVLTFANGHGEKLSMVLLKASGHDRLTSEKGLGNGILLRAFRAPGTAINWIKF